MSIYIIFTLFILVVACILFCIHVHTQFVPFFIFSLLIWSGLVLGISVFLLSVHVLIHGVYLEDPSGYGLRIFSVDAYCFNEQFLDVQKRFSVLWKS